MLVKDSITLRTKGDTDIIDITNQVKTKVSASGISDGALCLFAAGSTAAVTTIEAERGVINDLKKAIERIAPKDIHYEHDMAWGDGNGHAHVRAAIIGPSLSIPISKGSPLLGTWQQVVLIDFDNRPRKRRVVLHITGEK